MAIMRSLFMNQASHPCDARLTWHSEISCSCCSVVAVGAGCDGDRQLPQDTAFFALVHKEVLSVNK